MVVGLAEIGDKTQILSMMLAARFQRAVPVIFGILVATIANHAAAGLAGVFFGSLLTGGLMRWILGISFLGVAVWALFPDKYAGDDRKIGHTRAFLATLCAFFLAEIGDAACDDRPRGAVRGILSRRHRHHPRHDAGKYPRRADWPPGSGPAAAEGNQDHRSRGFRGTGRDHPCRDRPLSCSKEGAPTSPPPA